MMGAPPHLVNAMLYGPADGSARLQCETTAQVAATLITWMGEDWKRFDLAAAPPIQ